MSKYYVKRADGRDNTNEKYVVIRVDLGAKLVHLNRKAIKKFCKLIAGNDPQAVREIRSFMDELKSKEIKCEYCNRRGDFETSAGSHSFFKKCEKCNGKGLIYNG